MFRGGFPLEIPEFLPGARLLDGQEVQYLVNLQYSWGASLAAIAGGWTAAAGLQFTINNVTPVGVGAGVKLPVIHPGMALLVRNQGANTLKVYATEATTLIGAVYGNIGVDQYAGTDVLYWAVSLSEWLVISVPSGSSAASVTMKQMRQALVDAAGGSIYLVNNAVDADIASPENVQWNSGGIVVPGSDLATLIQTTLAYSDAQMAALFAAAAALPA